MHVRPTAWILKVIAGVRRMAWLWIGVFLVTAAGCESPDAGSSTATQVAVGAVTVEIDFRGRRENKKFQIPCSSESTVLAILERSQDAGDIEFYFTGSGETAFVRSIDGIENEQAAGDNWTYQVNGELGDRSCGAFPAKTGDQILWRFGEYP